MGEVTNFSAGKAEEKRGYLFFSAGPRVKNIKANTAPKKGNSGRKD